MKHPAVKLIPMPLVPHLSPRIGMVLHQPAAELFEITLVARVDQYSDLRIAVLVKRIDVIPCLELEIIPLPEPRLYSN